MDYAFIDSQGSARQRPRKCLLIFCLRLLGSSSDNVLANNHGFEPWIFVIQYRLLDSSKWFIFNRENNLMMWAPVLWISTCDPLRKAKACSQKIQTMKPFISFLFKEVSLSNPKLSWSLVDHSIGRMFLLIMFDLNARVNEKGIILLKTKRLEEEQNPHPLRSRGYKWATRQQLLKLFCH